MILILNCGSQSIKWKVYNEKLKAVAEGKRDVFDAQKFEDILAQELGQIKEDITMVGHRVVHGGSQFYQPMQITAQNLEELEKISHFAPLHNPYNILGIKTCLKLFVNAKQIAVFDTQFFANLPEKAFTYALPENIIGEFGFRRFGFQGTSHEYVARKAAQKLGKNFDKLKIITVHLGGGASVCAIKNGLAIDTSMGFTPLEGLVMMTRSGNIDAGIVLQLAEKYGAEKANQILNKESGLKGLCGEGNMLRVLEKTRSPEASQRRRAQLAFDVFVYSIQKYIGAYFAILGGCDILVFTGSIGSGDSKTRNAVAKGLDILSAKGGPASGWKIMAIKTDEELAIAQKIKNI